MILEAAATRPEWLEWRSEGAGASDVAPILGLSNWASPWSVWAEKCGLLPSEEDLGDDDPREFGRRAEAMIVPWFEDRTELTVAATQLWTQHDEHSWIRATPDGVVTDAPPCPGNCACPYYGEGHPDRTHHQERLRVAPGNVSQIERQGYLVDGLEAKTDFGKWWETIPVHYQTQGQWQMAATGWQRVHFAVLHGKRFRTYQLDRDDDDIAYMIERVGNFWHEHVLTRTPPPIDHSDATHAALMKLYPEADKERTQDVSHLRGVVRRYAQAKAEEKQQKQEADKARNELIDAMGNAYGGVIDGRVAFTLRSQTKRTICKHCAAVDETAPYRVLNVKPTTEETT